MTLSEICIRAADIIRERGLARGVVEDDKGRVCLLGAFNLAEHGTPHFDASNVIPTTSLWHPFRSWFIEHDIAHTITPDAPEAQVGYLRVDPVSWNNVYARDADDVAHALKLAAEHFALEEEQT